MIHFVLYYLNFLDHELTPIQDTHEPLQTTDGETLHSPHTNLLCFPISLKCRWPFCLLNTKTQAAVANGAEGLGMGMAGLWGGTGAELQSTPTIKALSPGFVVLTHAYTPIRLLFPLKQFSRHSLAYQRCSSRDVLYWIRPLRANGQGAC